MEKFGPGCLTNYTHGRTKRHRTRLKGYPSAMTLCADLWGRGEGLRRGWIRWQGLVSGNVRSDVKSKPVKDGTRDRTNSEGEWKRECEGGIGERQRRGILFFFFDWHGGD